MERQEQYEKLQALLQMDRFHSIIWEGHILLLGQSVITKADVTILLKPEEVGVWYDTFCMDPRPSPEVIFSRNEMVNRLKVAYYANESLVEAVLFVLSPALGTVYRSTIPVNSLGNMNDAVKTHALKMNLTHQLNSEYKKSGWNNISDRNRGS